MGLIKGGALRLFQTGLYFLAFCCAAVILGFYSYFLAVLADRNYHISTQDKAIEGISGVGVLYTIFAVVLTCCLAGVTFFSLIGLVMDVLLLGGFVAIAVLTRHSIHSCHGIVQTPIGTGPSNVGLGWDKSFTNTNNDAVYSVKYHTACLFNKACFAVSIIGAFIFLLTALMQILLIRSHKKDKRYGPGPSNNYTSGSGKRSLFSRKRNNKDAEFAAAGGLGVGATDDRPSHETGYTGTTVGGVGAINDDKLNAPAALPTHGSYHTAPNGAANPYYNQGTATNY